MRRIEEIIEGFKKYSPDGDVNLISTAYVFSARVHKDQLRFSGEPYLSHPLEVAYTLVQLKLDAVAIAGGLLHDTLEDTYATERELEELFGQEVLSLVKGLTKISKIAFASREEKEAENFRKMILAMTKDIRVILIKLADRYHNIKTLQHASAEQQKRIARETLDIYAPIANRLGIGWIKRDLEEYSFQFLYPDEYRSIEEKVSATFEARCKYINDLTKILEAELAKNGIPFSLAGRPKHYYSIYNKMARQGINFDELYDTIGIRVITDDLKDCYSILGIIHSLWKPIPGKFKDYIAMPKANMYQSLHTTVLGPEGHRVELQIRTKEMHEVCEEGIAAHWKYKEKREIKGDHEKFLWLRRLLEWHQELNDPKEFLDTVKVDLFPEEVYVFTPQGSVKGLPRGASPIDFAYLIHTDIGNHCVGAKVGGKMVSLQYALHSGDIVEILTSSTQTPHRDWLSYAKTSRAKAKIRSWLTTDQRKKSMLLGRELFQREVENYHLKPQAVIKSREFQHAMKEMGFNSEEKLMEGIGFGKISLASLMGKIIPQELLEERKKTKETEPHKAHDKGKHKRTSEPKIRVKGLNDILVRFCRCCNPIPGDPIIGFITRGKGVSIHDMDCPSIDLNIDSDRQVDVDWDLEDQTYRQVAITVTSENKVGLLAGISNAIASGNANIAKADISTPEKGPARLVFTIEVKGLDHLNEVVKSIRTVKGVVDVHREKHQVDKKNMASQND
ncbi:MAG: bifunctional (p)ppGpp synthetase/guanosine-3',5'-bis(diphosphate) 3'-pyrophosphohydrolase [Nitrospinae bacterium]|nr:bifunctional (p)ppGpp synthetase/guanosine-3',5'-bis(diphosphate) 3'-pyrophosphohydrolase [Nitrospinota bacterium]